MKKILPKLLLLIVFSSLLFANVTPVFAVDPPPPPGGIGVGSGGPPPPAAAADRPIWVQDRDVTFAGKIAARSRDMLNWVILHHEWADTDSPPPSLTVKNPFDAIWITIRNIVYMVLGLFVLAGAFLLIITRGKSLTVKKFVTRFILVLILVTLSYSLIAFLYLIGDIIQGFFFKRADGSVISAADLLDVGFDYGSFNQGLRVVGDKYDENVFISTLMVKLTAATYYAMFGILIVRKVILWFFIVVSPIFPLLLMFAHLRNSAKIWAGEFFRWLLYAPLFAIFLSGLVAMWRIYLPLNLQGVSCGVDDPIAAPHRYDTSISILLGGPCQKVALENSLNSPDAFIQYVVALIMLWMVIIVPFILLKIFLDYFNDFSLSESNMVKYLANSSNPILNRYGLSMGGGGVRPPPGGPSPSSHPAGLARSIPVAFTHSTIQQQAGEGMAREIESSMTAGAAANQTAFADTLNSIQQANSAENSQTASNIASAVSSATNEAVTNASNQSVTNINQATSNLASSNRQVSEDMGQHFGAQAASTFNNNFGQNMSSNVATSEAAQTIASAVSNATNTEASQAVINATNQATSNLASSNRQVSEDLGQHVGTSMSSLTNFGNFNRASSLSSSTTKGSNEAGLQAGVQAGVQAGLNASFPSGSIQAGTIEASNVSVGNIQVPQVTAQLLNLTNLNIPTMKDISRYESAMIAGAGSSSSNTQNTHTKEEVNKVYEALNRIAGVSVITTPSERTHYSSLRDRITEQAKKGDVVASSIMSASMPASSAPIPNVNKTQRVSVEDYEEVKKIWEENYRKLGVPDGPNGKPRTRQEWLQEEIKEIPTVIDYLMSGNLALQNKGKEMVSKILPFLLLGGFSKAEIVAYLKAKLQAAKNVLKEVSQEDQKDDLVEVDKKEVAKPKSMSAEAEIPTSLPDPSNPAATLEENKAVPSQKDDKSIK